MARVASNNNNNNDNITLPTITPFMDRLTHAVIKETSKSLKYYIDVKRRENAFILNPNTTALDSIPLKARFMYGTTKEYPPLYASCHSDNDVKVYLRSSQQKPRQSYSRSSSPEKKMCREELNFHMRSVRYSPRESQKFSELQLKLPSRRSTSSCSGIHNRESPKRHPKSSNRISRYEQDPLVDDAADILASMVKTRRTIYETNILSQQILPNYVSRNTNPSPRQTDEQSNVQSLTPSLTHPSNDLKLLTTIEESQKPKRTTDNQLAKAASIMHNAKPIEKGLLCEYKVSIKTGNCNGASTDAPISIKFYGSNGYTPFLNLVASETHRVPFLKDQTDVFRIQTYHVGQLAGITIGHDQKDMRSGWFLSKVLIDDPIRELTYDIPCNAWLSSKSNDEKTMRDFQVASMTSQTKKSNLNEHREEIQSQSDRSSVTNSSENNQLTHHKRTKRNSKQQQRVSIGPTTLAKTATSLNAITHHLSQPSPPTTFESHFNHNELSSTSVPKRQVHSPIINRTPSDTEIEDNLVDQSHSTSPILNPSLSNRRTSQTTDSTNHNRPPARLEKRNSSISSSPERPIKTNKDDLDSFFE